MVDVSMNTTIHLRGKHEVGLEFSPGRTRWLDILVNGDDVFTMFINDMKKSNVEEFTTSLRTVADEIGDWNRARTG
ncbi:hypothetical protein LCGC14_2412450 [marine sediment metagenome]|uniref:Uncharacterized protein n=1 Tax=marine sediment metagenome TaxID=412755 RepID=A0A0F9BS35_9ZZZZ